MMMMKKKMKRRKQAFATTRLIWALNTHIFTYDVWERNNRIKTLFFLYVFVCFFFLKSATNPFRLSNKTF